MSFNLSSSFYLSETASYNLLSRLCHSHHLCNIAFASLHRLTYDTDLYFTVRCLSIAFYTPPHVSGGVLCFHVGRPCVCPSVCPSPLMGTYWVGYLLSTCSLFHIGVHRTTQLILICCWVFCLLLGRNFVWEKPIRIYPYERPSVRSTYVRPSVVRTSVRLTSFPFDNLKIYKRISRLGLLMGKFR